MNSLNNPSLRIALIQCPLWGTRDAPVALAQLSSCLKKAGHQVFVFDLNIKLYLNRSNEYGNIWAWEQSDFWYKPDLVEGYCVKNNTAIDSYVGQVLDKKVKLVAFSVNIASLYTSIDFAQRIKLKDKDIKIVFGGPLFLENRYIGEVLNKDDIDVVIVGEGERALCGLAENISKGRDISIVPGIAFKEGSNIVTTGFALPVDLDSLPFLDFSDLPFTDYDDHKHISFLASRGCVRRCHFCSDSPCWPGYRAMSGERIFREIRSHKDANIAKINIGHVDFLDLAFNGNMETLTEFCDLMIKDHLDIFWNANMIVRPEMTQKIIEKISTAGCEHVIFGIESGSGRVLKSMNKHYNMSDADRIIKQMHQAGICVTANFMFGFPGETEEDFAQTLDFLKRNAAFLDRCYPSRTYFAIEKFSYVFDHPEEFGISPGFENHLFWEDIHGENKYPMRMERCRKFCELASKLGIEVGAGVQTSVFQDEYFNLAHYYETTKDYQRTVDNLLKYYELDRNNAIIKNKILDYKQRFDKKEFLLNQDTANKLDDAADIAKSFSVSLDDKSVAGRLKLKASRAFIKTRIKNIKKIAEAQKYDDKTLSLFDTLAQELIVIMDENPEYYDSQDVMQEYIETTCKLREKNLILNERELGNKNITLHSSPRTLFLQFAGPCNSSCVFCSRGHDYKYFNLEEFKEKIESKMASCLALAERFVLTGSGEFLQLKEWKEILDYFEKKYPYVEKMFSTNGSSLMHEVSDLITSQKSFYSIHASLHASNPSLHKIMTRMDNFDLIVEQIEYLLEKKRDSRNIKIDLFFVATVLNIEDLPGFVRLAKKLSVDSVIVNYNYIYVPAQKYLSCYFKPELTNKILNEAELLANDIGIKISLPPRFNEKSYPNLGICAELWSQVMLNDQGHVLPCDASCDCNLRLEGARSFYDIWNSQYYIGLREEIVRYGRMQCYAHCHRANPSSINLFASHVIHRGREGIKIDEFWEDNF